MKFPHRVSDKYKSRRVDGKMGPDLRGKLAIGRVLRSVRHFPIAE